MSRCYLQLWPLCIGSTSFNCCHVKRGNFITICIRNPRINNYPPCSVSSLPVKQIQYRTPHGIGLVSYRISHAGRRKQRLQGMKPTVNDTRSAG